MCLSLTLIVLQQTVFRIRVRLTLTLTHILALTPIQTLILTLALTPTLTLFFPCSNPNRNYHINTKPNLSLKPHDQIIVLANLEMFISACLLPPHMESFHATFISHYSHLPLSLNGQELYHDTILIVPVQGNKLDLCICIKL